MTKREQLAHRLRHKRLHAVLDELIADYLTQQLTTKKLRGKKLKLISNTTLAEFVEWSYQQTIEPTPIGPLKEVRGLLKVE